MHVSLPRRTAPGGSPQSVWWLEAAERLVFAWGMEAIKRGWIGFQRPKGNPSCTAVFFGFKSSDFEGFCVRHHLPPFLLKLVAGDSYIHAVIVSSTKIQKNMQVESPSQTKFKQAAVGGKGHERALCFNPTNVASFWLQVDVISLGRHRFLSANSSVLRSAVANLARIAQQSGFSHAQVQRNDCIEDHRSMVCFPFCTCGLAHKMLLIQAQTLDAYGANIDVTSVTSTFNIFQSAFSECTECTCQSLGLCLGVILGEPILSSPWAIGWWPLRHFLEHLRRSKTVSGPKLQWWSNHAPKGPGRNNPTHHSASKGASKGACSIFGNRAHEVHCFLQSILWKRNPGPWCHFHQQPL